MIVVIIMLFAIFLPPIAQIDFQAKVMFNAPMEVLVRLIPLLLLFFWVAYVLTRRFLYSRTMTWIHILITISTTILMMIVLYIGIKPFHSGTERQVNLMGISKQVLFILFIGG